MNSKQRPRRLAVFGSNGTEYNFLLKGHEDLRQDERVMQVRRDRGLLSISASCTYDGGHFLLQLFGLVNALLASADDGESDQSRRALLEIAAYL
jgi:hypothetical protein